MSEPQALLLESVHETAAESLRAQGITVQTRPKGLAEDDLIATLQGLGDGPVIVGLRSKTHVTPRVFAAVPNLMAVGAFCIGTDQIALSDAQRRGVPVFNAPFSSTRSVAELVVAEVVMLSRGVFQRSMAAHGGKWDKSATGSHEVRGKTLGIIGYGHIGSQVSILAEAFGMRVLYFDIDLKLPLGNAVKSASMAELLANSDFVTLHVPDTPLTRGMLGDAELGQMKPGAFLLNLSRGKVVDIDALRERLVSGHIAGAAVDVYPEEPASRSEEFRSGLRGLDNAILTPHIGGSTVEAQANIGREVANALVRWVHGGSTLGCVTLPQLDVPVPPRWDGKGSRIVNVHSNVPGVLSAINSAVADSAVNIVGQSLATNEEVGLLFIDVPITPSDPKATQLRDAIDALETSVRTRLIAL
ncbi:MAG: phosphoglycerate dehydrogenase [Myxococcota bacterium]